MSTSTVARRMAAIAALALLAVPLAGMDAGAEPHEVCTGGSSGTHVTSAFCVSFTAAIGPTLNARDPFDADIAFANTSDNHQADQTRWIETITVHLASSDTTAPSVTPSKALPNHLVIAGDDGDCTSPSFSGCDAGHGVFVVNISGTGIPLVDGDHTGTFGINRVVNMNDADTDSGTIRYRFDLEACATVLSSCDLHQSYSEEVESPIPPPTAGGALNATLQVFQEGDQMFQGQTGHYAATLDSGEIHLKGTASKLDDGSDADEGPFDVFRFPARCGTVGGSGVFTSHRNPNPDTVEIAQQSAAIGGCPTAAFTRSIHGSSVTFNAGGSAAHVAGRTVKSWRWAFGDGAHLSKLMAVAAHTYPASPATPTDYTAQLIVV